MKGKNIPSGWRRQISVLYSIWARESLMSVLTFLLFRLVHTQSHSRNDSGRGHPSGLVADFFLLGSFVCPFLIHPVGFRLVLTANKLPTSLRGGGCHYFPGVGDSYVSTCCCVRRACSFIVTPEILCGTRPRASSLHPLNVEDKKVNSIPGGVPGTHGLQFFFFTILFLESTIYTRIPFPGYILPLNLSGQPLSRNETVNWNLRELANASTADCEHYATQPNFPCIILGSIPRGILFGVFIYSIFFRPTFSGKSVFPRCALPLNIPVLPS